MIRIVFAFSAATILKYSREKEEVMHKTTPSPAESNHKRGFSPQFWLVVIFEFFERGAYYGMMSFLSVYFSDSLGIPKENVGVIKGVIQPLLYFLPILSGAVADRFGYRRMLMVAFALLGGGYFLTAQMTTYTGVFIALVVMGVGAGIFKPLISGTIARVTDESNSTQAFGIYYWSINLGAFLFPLFLVPFLKQLNPAWVIIASAICTGAMIIPTLFFFRDPVRQQKADDRKQTSMIQTLANAFEIIYSPLVLIYRRLVGGTGARTVLLILLAGLVALGAYQYLSPPMATVPVEARGRALEQGTLQLTLHRDMLRKENFHIDSTTDQTRLRIEVFKPDTADQWMSELLSEVQAVSAFSMTNSGDLRRLLDAAKTPRTLGVRVDSSQSEDYRIRETSAGTGNLELILKRHDVLDTRQDDLASALEKIPDLQGTAPALLTTISDQMDSRPFFVLFVGLLILSGLLVLRASGGVGTAVSGSAGGITIGVLVLSLLLWLLPGLGTLARIICSVLLFSTASLSLIDRSQPEKFVDHGRFLLMIILYSGFWVLYFQMFDSVLWYVQAYVDAGSLNAAINRFLGWFGIRINWFFDVEHVTVVNAGAIILLQLFVSRIVKNFRALPTMITGIAIATLGMGILAVSTDIWVFLAGIFLFSIGEMTAHPKFISYIGLVAPTDRKAMYMGYLFLYGVFGSSVGGVLGAKLYVHFVDHLNQPRLLWLIFSGIGVATIIGLLLYNKFIAPEKGDR